MEQFVGEALKFLNSKEKWNFDLRIDAHLSFNASLVLFLRYLNKNQIQLSVPVVASTPEAPKKRAAAVKWRQKGWRGSSEIEAEVYLHRALTCDKEREGGSHTLQVVPDIDPGTEGKRETDEIEEAERREGNREATEEKEEG